jgi:hypothetical protein
MRWDREDHQRRLEAELMQLRLPKTRSTLAQFALVGGLVLAGGVAGATTMAWIDRWNIEEEDLPGDEKRVTITDTQTGQSEVVTVPDDTAFFAIEADEGQEETLIGVTPLEDDPQDPEQEPRKKPE